MYRTVIKAIGAEAETFKSENMLILFGENAPDTLKDYCYTIEVNPVEKDIESEMILKIDSQEYSITAVGEVVGKNLNDLGHITIKFDGNTTADLPGTLHVEANEFPALEIGTTIEIL